MTKLLKGKICAALNLCRKVAAKTAVLTVIIIMAVRMTACTYGFPSGFDKEKCIKRAEEIIEIVNSRDYETLHSILRDDLKENVTVDDFREAWDVRLDKVGEFKKFGKPVLSGETDMDTGDDFAMVVYYCYYENGKATFTIYFDSNMEMTSISAMIK